MILFPPCKINLGLQVLNKREDGFHNLDTVFLQLLWTDILEITPTEKFEFVQTGLSITGNQEDNLCVKAYNLISNLKKITPVRIHLHKILPMGAGLGGGSADATYTLIGLNKVFNLQLSDDELRTLSLSLGSDCPLFVSEKPQFASGRGEILEEINIDLSGKYIQLINIGIHINTKEAFQNLKATISSDSTKKIITEPIENWKNNLKNDFEDGIFNLYPNLKEIKAILYNNGAQYASMTGTGSTIYGIFDHEPSEINFEGENVIQKIIPFKNPTFY